MRDPQSGAAPQPGSGVTPADFPTLRAAYSDRTAALMAQLAAIAYNQSIEAKPAVLVPPPLSVLGFSNFWAFHNGMTDGFAYIARSPDLIVLSFRGTRSVQNWETNFRVHMTHPPGTANRLLVHDGFYHAFKLLADGADGIGERLEAIKKDTQGKIPIYITGHSLGGALAQIASAVFGDDQVAACYTFGSPRVGNPYFDLWVKVPSYRLINHADIVPQVPHPLPLIASYRHSGDPRYLRREAGESVYRYQPGTFARLWHNWDRASSNGTKPDRFWALRTTRWANIRVSSSRLSQRARKADSGG
ncbi:MAG: lipase family protein [Beijerinckiaceae bacterium]|nr:lipase family protein [Beijerinckiaceae bacterium]